MPCTTLTHMSETVGIRELQQNASRVIARVVDGEEIEVTERGRPVARLVPLRPSKVEQLTASGRLRPAKHPLDELPPPIETPPGSPSASQILAELRAEER